MSVHAPVRRAAAVLGIVLILLGGAMAISFLIGLASRDTSTRCVAPFKQGDRGVYEYERALANEGYDPRVSGDPADKGGATLRVSVGTEFLSIVGVKDDENGAELEATMRRLIPDLPRQPCLSEGLNS